MTKYYYFEIYENKTHRGRAVEPLWAPSGTRKYNLNFSKVPTEARFLSLRGSRYGKFAYFSPTQTPPYVPY